MSRYLLLECVSACNLRCAMCAHREHFSGKSLAKKKISEIFEDMMRLMDGVPYNKFIGLRLDGNTEPLIYKELKWLLDEVESKFHSHQGLGCSLVTNGLLLNRDIARYLLEKNIRSIHISVTGLSAEVYQYFQGSNQKRAYAKKILNIVRGNIKSLCELKRELGCDTLIELRYIISDRSVTEFIDYLNYWRELGIDQVFVSGLGDGILKHASKGLGKISSYKSCTRFGQVVVQATGDVILSCCDYLMESVGNIYENSFFDIMTSPMVLKYEKAHKELDIKNLPPICVNCPDMHIYEETEPALDKPLMLTELEYSSKKFLESLSGKKLIVFGSGAEFQLVKKRYLRGCKIAYLVDNEIQRQNTVLEGLLIKSPKVLAEENSEKTMVLIASSSFFAIEKQLKSLGVKYYYSSLLFLDRYFAYNGHAPDNAVIRLH